MTQEEKVSRPHNNSGWVTRAICEEKVKRIDGEVEAVRAMANSNSARIDRIQILLISTLTSSIFSLLGVIAILIRGAMG